MNIELKIQEIVKAYEKVILGIEKKAQDKINGRAYGGIVRSGKGKLVESLAKYLIEIAWQGLNADINKLVITKKTEKIPIKKEYIVRIKNPVIREYISKNINRYNYPLRVDWSVFVDNFPALFIECKAYTENAMLKRILVDFTLLKQVYSKANFVLFQLESQLGGDYSKIVNTKFGSYSTHTLLSHFDINLHIITLLQGERKVDRPIHKPDYYKPLKAENIKKVIEIFRNILKYYA